VEEGGIPVREGDVTTEVEASKRPNQNKTRSLWKLEKARKDSPLEPPE